MWSVVYMCNMLVSVNINYLLFCVLCVKGRWILWELVSCLFWSLSY